MKIAFTSCMSSNSYQQQQVWDAIGAKNPDFLVLLGDSVYIDCPPQPDNKGNQHPSDNQYLDNDFAIHLHKLYQNQLAVPQFKKLINNQNLKTYAIWDDHDFLWNDADSGDSKNKLHMNQAIISSNLLGCWRDALFQHGNGFPKSTSGNDPLAYKVWKNYKTPVDLSLYDGFMPGYSHVQLQAGIHLHLTDGRSWRTHNEMLGSNQRNQIEKVFEQFPDDVHIVASGSTFGKHGSNGWHNCKVDESWMLSMASQFRVVMLSGDIHKNVAPAPIQPKQQPGFNFYEFTSSGAGVNFNPLNWSPLAPINGWLNFSQKFGMLEITDKVMNIELFDHGIAHIPALPSISLATW